MEPVSPVLGEEFAAYEVIYAADQPEYIPLPVLKSDNGVLLSRWRLTSEERAAIAGGADILLSSWTFNRPLQPVRVEVAGCDRPDIAVAFDMGLIGYVRVPERPLASQKTPIPAATDGEAEAQKEKQWREASQS